jgi:CheY-like chemotaxis protein
MMKSGNNKEIRILVAEDNAVNLKVTLLHLKKLGFEAEAVINGREAVQSTAQCDYDVILMDCQMPEMDGYEATRQIRQREALGHSPRHTFIIAVTANAMPGDREKCLMAGMDDFVSKPVQTQSLYSAIERCLRVPGNAG